MASESLPPLARPTVGASLRVAGLVLLGLLLFVFDAVRMLTTMAWEPAYLSVPAYQALTMMATVQAALLFVVLLAYRRELALSSLVSYRRKRLHGLCVAGALISLACVLFGLVGDGFNRQALMFDHPNLGLVGVIVFGGSDVFLRRCGRTRNG
ncbi:MAG: hypothetical protein H6816_09530 [Phycisphaerales bacterium]|nr:hypothetical protein [Phycisphaerales bacterium]